MRKSHPPYSPEFRQRIVELVRKGRTPEELALQFEPSAETIRNWVKAAKAGKLHPAGGKTVTPEQMELSRVRAENARLRMENEILKNRPRGYHLPYA